MDDESIELFVTVLVREALPDMILAEKFEVVSEILKLLKVEDENDRQETD